MVMNVYRVFKYMNDKDKWLKRIYIFKKKATNFYKETNVHDKPMTLSYIKDWYNHFKQPKTQLKGTNSYIAPKPFYEYQIDLFFLPDQPKPNIGLACIDIFTKYAVVIPISSKQVEDITDGLHTAIHKMGKKPEII